MAQSGTYEYECMRAELFGVEKPTREAFEEQQKLKAELESENVDIEAKNQLEADDEQINETHGKVDELNSILSITQQKLNKFKKTCGSLTSLLKFRATPTGSAAGSNENLASGSHESAGPSLNNALDTLDAIKDAEQETTGQQVKKTSAELHTKVNSHLDKLDSLLSKTERAENAMNSQNKQMRKML